VTQKSKVQDSTKNKGGMNKMEMCILCKKEPAVGKTTNLFCENCQKEECLAKLAAYQRDTRFKEGSSKYQDECWRKEFVLKTNVELSNYLQKKCVSFSKDHLGFKEILKEVKKLNESIPKLIHAKIELRKSTKGNLKETKEKIKSLQKLLESLNKNFKESILELKEIKDKKDKKSLKRILIIQKKIQPLEDLQEEIDKAKERKDFFKEELERLRKI